jgi:hypothetical protein
VGKGFVVEVESEGTREHKIQGSPSFLKQPLPASRTFNSNPPLDRIQTIADRYGLLNSILPSLCEPSTSLTNLAPNKLPSFTFYQATPIAHE